RLRTSSRTQLAIVAELPNVPQVLEELVRLRPQAVMVLLSGDPAHAFQLVERIRQDLPKTSVVCSSEDNSPEVILQSFRSGAIELSLRSPRSLTRSGSRVVRKNRQLVESSRYMPAREGAVRPFLWRTWRRVWPA
ncbi:MAG: hypothetical protein ACOYLN_14030, partial [Blastocatellia bacterium]